MSLASTMAPASSSACTASRLPSPWPRSERRLARRVGRVGVGAAFEQQPDHRGVAVLRRERQRRHAVAVGALGRRRRRGSARAAVSTSLTRTAQCRAGVPSRPGALTSIPVCWSSGAPRPCRASGRRRPGAYPGQPPAAGHGPDTATQDRPGQASGKRCVAASIPSDYRPWTGGVGQSNRRQELARLRPDRREGSASLGQCLSARTSCGRVWLNAQQGGLVFLRQHVDQAVGALPHVADALVQIAQQRLRAAVRPSCR